MPASALDPDGPVPLWRQLADDLRARIEAGEFAPGRAIPSMRVLCQSYDVGQKTAEHALSWLAGQGVTVTVPGKGSYVRDPGKGST
jgi:DNA-binding GntR family transcriptional regulator